MGKPQAPATIHVGESARPALIVLQPATAKVWRALAYTKTEAMMTKIEQFETEFEKIHNAHFVGTNDRYQDVLNGLNVREQDLVRIAAMDGQVLNGGFSQWIGNGYSENGEALLEALRRLETPHCATVRDIVQKALEMGNEPCDVEDFDDWTAALDRLDDEYYAVQSLFIEGVAGRFCS